MSGDHGEENRHGGRIIRPQAPRRYVGLIAEATDRLAHPLYRRRRNAPFPMTIVEDRRHHPDRQLGMFRQLPYGYGFGPACSHFSSQRRHARFRTPDDRGFMIFLLDSGIIASKKRSVKRFFYARVRSAYVSPISLEEESTIVP